MDRACNSPTCRITTGMVNHEFCRRCYLEFMRRKVEDERFADALRHRDEAEAAHRNLRLRLDKIIEERDQATADLREAIALLRDLPFLATHPVHAEWAARCDAFLAKHKEQP